MKMAKKALKRNFMIRRKEMAKKAVRVKADVHELNLQTADDVALAIKEIGDLEREQVRLATLQADEKVTIDEKYTAELTALKDKVKPLQKAAQEIGRATGR